ncbi:GNAT family N-acetyltransferase [Paenibacillus sp. GP183]|jgi:GNAT superfamily N-acetyltransferase|uniref:GNAT family N-acetyltransferase n=1 Tax=Paenibacillus sp. GP183 TaxID=1882751 RepID=UPI0008986565|nr:GNAT family N-acetyltransferase [Paenibacillus sp. GP183]SEB53012.1 Acetyltransferase (GNAT) family protein [Paenibacillus sp. GP183]
MNDLIITELDSEGILKLKDFDCSPLPKERDSIYFLFYRFFRDTCRLAYVNDELVGFALGLINQTDPDHAYLHYLFVRQDQRKNKIGEKLLNEFIESSRNKKCKRISLMTSNPMNEQYYSRFGFVQDKELIEVNGEDPLYTYLMNEKKMLFYRLDL